ncbi:MAG: cytochrome c3 family protein [Acidobacteria bacterium]|nr:cytochrome c3 family protein [Acidobacteriota bacterium]
MNRTMIALISILAVVTIVAIGEYDSNVSGANSGTRQPSDGCVICHPKLSAQVPEGHFKTTLNELKFCLTCHALEGAASAFTWTRHQRHYAVLGAAANCWLCHQLDANGNFRLIGVNGSKEIKTTPEVVAKMEPYYLSWATSSHLDRKHGEQSVICSTCHETAFPEATVKKEKCFTCHGSYEQIAEQAPIHFSAIYPHFQTGPVECNACHKAHEQSVLVCNQCHNFDYEVP